MAETPAQRRLRYLRDRQLKGRRRRIENESRARPATGGYWANDADTLSQRRQAATTRGDERQAANRFIDETIKVQRREFTQNLQSRIRELRDRLEAMTPDERAQMEDSIRKTIRELREAALARRQGFIQYRSTQRDFVRTTLDDKRNMSRGV